MKNLKIVLLLAVPIALVAFGLWYSQSVNSTDPGWQDPTGNSGGNPQTGGGRRGPIPEKDPGDPIVPPRGDKVLFRPTRTPTDGDQEPLVLTVDKLKELLAKGDNASWQLLRHLINEGNIEDPFQVGELLIGALGKVDNAAAFLHVFLPTIIAKTPEIDREHLRDTLVEGLMNVARTSTDELSLRGAFEALGQLGAGSPSAGRVVAELAGLVSSMESPLAQTQAVLAIGSIGTPESAAALADLFSKNHDKPLGAEILKAITRVRDPAMVERLVPLLAAPGAPGFRLKVIEAIGYTKQASAAKTLLGLLEKEEDPSARRAVFAALGHTPSPDAAKKLVEIVRNGSPEDALDAGRALGLAEGPQVVQPILGIIDEVEDERIKVRMVRALGNSGSEVAQAKLEQMLDSDAESKMVRGRAGRALGEMGDAGAVESMTKALSAAGGDDRSLKIDLLHGLSHMNMIRSEKAREELKKHALPVLEKLAEENGQGDPVGFYALRALRLIDPRGR